MNIGNGSLGITSPESVSGSPFAAGSAENGLSIDPVSSKVVLGDDTGIAGLAKLLSNRFIDLQTFLITLIHTFGQIDLAQSSVNIYGDQSNGFPSQAQFFDINDPNNNGIASITPATGETFFANINYVGGNTTGIGCSRNLVRVSKSLTTPPGAATGALLEVEGGVSTSDPGAGRGVWKLGKKAAAAVAFDNANYIEVDIDGVIYKLALAV